MKKKIIENEFVGEELVKPSFAHVDEFGEIVSHSHNSFELNFVLEGNGRLDIGKYFYAVSGGEVFVVPPKVEHSYMFVGEGKIFHLLISEEFFTQFEDLLIKTDGYEMLFSTQPELRIKNGYSASLSLTEEQISSLSTLIKDFFDSELKTSDVLLGVTALNLITKICHYLSINNKSDDYDDTLKDAVKILTYLNNNLDEKITLEDLCEKFSMSKITLLSEFKRLTGTTPQKHLNEYRLKTAYGLLVTTDKKVTEISKECGFYDDAHFCREFKREFGVTPKELRKNNE